MSVEQVGERLRRALLHLLRRVDPRDAVAHFLLGLVARGRHDDLVERERSELEREVRLRRFTGAQRDGLMPRGVAEQRGADRDLARRHVAQPIAPIGVGRCKERSAGDRDTGIHERLPRGLIGHAPDDCALLGGSDGGRAGYETEDCHDG